MTALENRCPHRWASLSKGRLIGDAIECPYHGLTFDADGKCIKVPSQSRIPDCALHAYPLVEKSPFVWIWMGEPEQVVDHDPPVSLDWFDDAEWTVGKGAMHVDGNYMLLHDNLMDLTHFGFVHRDSLDFGDWIHPPAVSTTEKTVTFRQVFGQRKLAGSHLQFTRTDPDRLADEFVTEGSWVTPAIHLAAEYIRFDGPSGGQRTSFTFRIAHAMTPVDAGSTRYFFALGWDVVTPPGTGDAMAKGAAHVFEEDKEIVEQIATMLSKDLRGFDYPEIKLQADTPQLHARRKLEILLADER